MKSKLEVYWSPAARESLRNICKYIRKDSPTAAVKVRTTLLSLAKSLNDFPEKYALEETLCTEEVKFRSVTVWHYKMIYEVADDFIIITYLMHTSQDIQALRSKK